MKAVRVHELGEPKVLGVEEVPDLRPGMGQVVVRIKAAGVNPVETYVRAGRSDRKPALPYTPGSDAGGIVEFVGPNVTRVEVGSRVYTSGSLTGTYAQQALCEERQVHPLPDGLSFAQGAAVNIPYATAYYALFRRAKAAPAETVLIHGATGGVGIASVQLARAAGMVVIGTGGTEKGRDLLGEQGVAYVLDHSAPGYLDALPSLTGGRGVDVILEMLANVNLDRDLKILAREGRLVVIGSRGRIEIDPRDIMSRNATVTGMLLFNIPAPEIDAIHSALGAGLANGTLQPVVGKEFRLAQAPQAHQEILEHPALGKIVLIP